MASVAPDAQTRSQLIGSRAFRGMGRAVRAAKEPACDEVQEGAEGGAPASQREQAAPGLASRSADQHRQGGDRAGRDHAGGDDVELGRREAALLVRDGVHSHLLAPSQALVRSGGYLLIPNNRNIV